MTASYDAIVVGAGPYGLSTAAHLRGRGLSVATVATHEPAAVTVVTVAPG